MGSRTPALFARHVPVAVRSLVAGCLAFAVLQLLSTTSHYATAAALAGVALLAVWDAARLEAAPPLSPGGAPEQRRLLRELDRSAALLDAVTVALFAVSAEGRIGFANRAARRLAGTVPARLADLATLGPDAAAEILAMPAGARRILNLADGRPALTWTAGLAVPGEPPQTLVSLQMVAGELDAVQLRAWQDMTRVLAHEIMNSLTPIASLSESAAALLASGDAPPSEASRAVDAVARRSAHLIGFVERYREVADLPEPRPRPVPAEALAAELEAVMAPGLAARGIAFARTLGPAGLVFLADPELLAQALLNLLRNAADAAAAAPSPVVHLACAASGADIAWTVTDNGHGIPPDQLHDIFVPFFTTKASGAGIGLTLARQIALAHGGGLEASAAPGGGARFILTLPCRK